MQVEDVTRIGLPARRAPQQQRDLPVGGRVLGEVVVDADRVPPAVAEELTDGAAGVGSQVLQRSRLGGGGRHHDGVVHGVVVRQGLNHLGDGGALLADGHVDADDVAALLIDDGVHRHGRLSRLPVSDNELPLPPPDGDHRVDGLEPGLQGLLDGLAIHDSRSDALDRIETFGGNGPLAVDRLPQGVHHATDHGVSHRNRHDLPGPLHQVAFLDFGSLAQQHRAHLILLQVERHSGNPVGELQQFAVHHFFQAVDPGNAVPDRNDRPHFADHRTRVEILDLRPNDLTDLFRLDSHQVLSPAQLNPAR